MADPIILLSSLKRKLLSFKHFGRPAAEGKANRERNPTPDNVTMLQGFEWNIPADQKHWKRLASAIAGLKAVGIDNLWIPPGCKASSPRGNGYDIYDLYDLGEFDQKGGVATKFGTKEELLEMMVIANEVGMGVYWDAVLNHKAAADSTETCSVVEVDPKDRNKVISKPFQIEAWMGFDFPGRGEKYSSQKYHWQHFNGTDFNAANSKTGIYRIHSKQWSEFVGDENGNADYMMFSNVDYTNEEVKQDVKRWGEWICREIGISGMRLDAVQHYSEVFVREFINHIERYVGGDHFFVGEFWVGDVKPLKKYIERFSHGLSLFDAPLLYNFSRISKTRGADLTKVFRHTLVAVKPKNAVTLVMNHDTQLGQTVETPIKDFFVPLAYALILLRADGYPCVFYGDLYGIQGEHPSPPSCGGKLADLVLARKLYAYGQQEDYFDTPNCIAWVRRGTPDKPDGLVVVMSNTKANKKKMLVGETHRGETWTDILGWGLGEVKVDEEGYGVFPCPRAGVAVWINREAEGRDRFGKL
ncbi:MAG: hypothetical protein M1812_002105 [Candelaria pacifica]|nr:MAG: hypothetical protein M1812_002105 [Candelaria pacifica]